MPRVACRPVPKGERRAEPAARFVLASGVAVGTAVPFAVCRFAARRFGVPTGRCCAACGGLAGAVLGPPLRVLLPGSDLDGFPKGTPSAECLAGLTLVGPVFLIAGALGGLVYRLIDGGTS